MIVNHVSRLLGERRESIAQFARRSDISYPTAHRLYSGTTQQIDLAVLEKICAYLDVGVGEIFSYDPTLVESAQMEGKAK